MKQSEEKSTSTVRVLVCRVGHEPRLEDAATDLASLQALVGGYLECVGLGDGVDLWCNESGRIDGLPFNREVPGRSPWVPEEDWDLIIRVDDDLAPPGAMGVHLVHGDFFLATASEDGELASLGDVEAAHYLEVLGRAGGAPSRS
jgi:hypothetical protein